jgi:hypothetical protein
MKAATYTGNFQLANSHHETGSLQASFAAWQREAARIAREYLRTGRAVHRSAFERHMGGMLLRLRKGQA